MSTQRAHRSAAVQPRGQPEWCFTAECAQRSELLRGAGLPYRKCQLSDRCHATHSHRHMLAHVHAALHLFSRRGGGTQGLLLESTEAFYRTALRRGHCATQAHSGRRSLTPAYTPIGDNGKGGYILPKKKEQENEREGKRSQRSGGIEAVSCSSIHQLHPPPPHSLLIFTLPNPSSSLLSGGLRQTHSHAHTHTL